MRESNAIISHLFQLYKDLLNPSQEETKARHKLKRLVQSPNSYFMDVKCPGKPVKILYINFFRCVVVAMGAGCYKITTVFSHAQTVVLCVSCSTVLCQPTGGKARLTEGKNILPPLLCVPLVCNGRRKLCCALDS